MARILLLLCASGTLSAAGLVEVRVAPQLAERRLAYLALPPRPAPRRQQPRPAPPDPVALQAAAERALQEGRPAAARERLRLLLDGAPRARLRLAAYRLLARVFTAEKAPERALECLGNAESVLAQIPLKGRRSLLAEVYRERMALLSQLDRGEEAALYEWAAWRAVHGPLAAHRPADDGRTRLSASAAWLAAPAPSVRITTNAWFFAGKRGSNPPGLPAGLLPEGIFLEPGFERPLATPQADAYRVELVGETPSFVEGPHGFTAWLENGRITRVVQAGAAGTSRIVRVAWDAEGRPRRLAVFRIDPARDARGLVPEIRLVVFPAPS